MFDIITVGSATVDVFIHTDPEQSELFNLHNHPDICYRLGSKILVKEVEFFTGGGGSNTAVAFSRLGLKTGFLGRIGDDPNGELIMKDLHKEKVTFIGYKGGISGYSSILDSVKEDRTIFTFKGCNDDLDLKHIQKYLLDSRWFYFSSMMHKSFSALEYLSKHSKKKNIKIAFNPSLYLVKKGKKHLSKILKNCEILLYNKEEAQSMLNSKSENIYELLYHSSLLGPKIVVITDGKNGANALDAYEQIFYSIKPVHVKINETTGAGDAFASGFVTAKILGKNTEYALRLGMLNAESVIKHKGAKNILLNEKAFDMAEKDLRPVYKTQHKI
ncbi:TPA: carbohydrate kinase family protein [Candidatus Woesearchaeota archaeon]|nr:carbohydrate kinase family protein [Candidatus Woesearchaeota archaeon]HIH31686.1 carbohydrate kinase family protein [Candidatus Woesearchaeota archaeon]HIH54949.1 carbohydrate kinase family protein [Candidatus Woesearchaeota archaeon]HIJ02642.1 carbohydrate kinase family protein [Candidatus Woesearchaeota archaeon]HIJ13620.1 carbohydrate kinase family protein [Candidatus Woesearchaeota archaeon]